MAQRKSTTESTQAQGKPGALGNAMSPGAAAAHFAQEAKATPAPRAQATATALSPIEAAHAVFGERPRDVLFHIDAATGGLSWCEAVFRAIEVLHEQGGGALHIQRLANAGYYIAESIGANVQGVREEMQARIEAAEAAEGEMA